MGPVDVAEFMRLAMLGERSGYYTQGSPIGAAGDFITAPEISQMFGELIGLWTVDTWEKLGKPDPVLLVELGPGRGTLMADCLRAAALRPEFTSAMRLHLIEISEPLRREQQSRLGAFAPSWHTDIATLPLGPAIILGNEFLDVLPIHQFQLTASGWMERAIGENNGALAWTLVAAGAHLGLLRPVHRRANPGDIAEVSPAALGFMATLARRLQDQGGAALFIDYGMAASGLGASFQAVKGHRLVDPLSHFGEADLTAHVDFAAMAEAASSTGAAVQGPMTQQAFLGALGIGARAERLCEGKDATSAKEIRLGLDRLTGADQMGNLFKVMAIRRSGAPECAGFA